MILGFLGFCLAILLQSGLMSHHDDYNFIINFEFAHVVIFFIALAFIIQSVCLWIGTLNYKDVMLAGSPPRLSVHSVRVG